MQKEKQKDEIAEVWIHSVWVSQVGGGDPTT